MPDVRVVLPLQQRILQAVATLAFSRSEISIYYRARAPRLKQRSREWRGPCPIHSGKRDNFAVDPETGRWFCHSACGRGGDILDLEEETQGGDFATRKARVFALLGRSEPDWRRSNLERNALSEAGTWHEVDHYQYTDEAGKLLYEVVRRERGQGADREKNFRQRRPDGKDGWSWDLDGVVRVPYRLPKVLNAKTVYLPEGERDVHTLEEWGLVGSCNSGGSGSSHLYAQWENHFRGRHIVILVDNDQAGRKHAAIVADALLTAAASVCIVELPDLPEKGDVTDWRRAGGTLDGFLELVNATSPIDAAGLSDLRARWGLTEKQLPAAPKPALYKVESVPALSEAALYGLAGKVVNAILPHTEADPAALLLHFLAAYGNMIGRSAYCVADGAKHHTNFFFVCVGSTSKGRKGTSWNRIRNLLEKIDRPWIKERVQSGLSSGEGLIAAVADRGSEATDRRLLVIQPEFASTLKVMARDGNTLSGHIREAWDSGSLHTMVKREPLNVEDAHISIVGHITRDELRRRLGESEAGNGFANRFLWAHSSRSKCLPEGGNLHDADLDALADQLRPAVEFGRSAGLLERDCEARDLWKGVYPELSEGQSGMLGAVTSRAEAQVLRLSMLYALLDCSPLILVQHLKAALALWDYCAASAKWIFGAAIGDRVADKILPELRRAGESGMSRTEISGLFGRNRNAQEIGSALTLLEDRRLAHHETFETEGRCMEVWFAGPYERNENTN